MNDQLTIAGKKFTSRLFIGTGKYAGKPVMRDAILAAGSELVTVALRRIDLKKSPENILSYLPAEVTIMVNTSGARNAREAVRIARLAKESGLSAWIKVEIINDSKYLLPDNEETIRATEILAEDGFVVLPYMNPDLYVARALVKAGAAAIMPLGSLIGSNQGLRAAMMLEILIAEIDEVPIVVDAGLGRPSQAAAALEMGAAAVLVNTAIAVAGDPARMAAAFKKGVEAGREAYLAKLGPSALLARASSPPDGFIRDDN